MKVPSKSELKDRIEYLENQNAALLEKQDAEQIDERERRKPEAIEKFYQTVGGIFGKTVCNVKFEHADAAGYWFTFELTNDPRRQTIRINLD